MSFVLLARRDCAGRRPYGRHAPACRGADAGLVRRQPPAGHRRRRHLDGCGRGCPRRRHRHLGRRRVGTDRGRGLRPDRARHRCRRQSVGGDALRARLTARSAPQPATGSDKTSLVLYIGQDHPGALLEILTEFAVRGVNLTRIESRPTGGGIGDYLFSVDIEGHVDDARVGEALMGLRRVCADVRYLGSYPRVDGGRPALRRGRVRPRLSRRAGLAGAHPGRPYLTHRRAVR